MENERKSGSDRLAGASLAVDPEEEETSTSVVVVPAEAVREAADRGKPLSVEIRSVTVAHAGPLPAPSTLSHYDEVHPGLSSIIVTEFQAESANRRRLQWVGQSGAIGIAALSIIAGEAFGYATNDYRITLAITVPVCGAVGISQALEFWLKLRN